MDAGRGVKLWYRAIGTGPEAIVVVHGGPGGDSRTAPDLAPLAHRFRVIHYDQRGGGRSSLPEDTGLLAADFFVEDLERVRRHFALERLNVLAHSFGAVIVARYLEQHPGRVAQLFLLKPVPLTRTEAGALAQAEYERSASGPRLMQVVTSLLDGTAPDAVAACREYERLSQEDATARGEGTLWLGSGCDAAPEAVRYAFRNTARLTADSFGDWDFTRSLRATNARLLVMAGDRHAEVVPHMRAWAAAVPDGRVQIVKGVGEGVPLDRPDVFFPAVRIFFGGGWPEGAETPSR